MAWTSIHCAVPDRRFMRLVIVLSGSEILKVKFGRQKLFTAGTERIVLFGILHVQRSVHSIL